MSNGQRRGPGTWARSRPPVSRPKALAVAGRPVSRRKAGHAVDRVMRRPCGSGQASGSSVGPQASALRHGGPVAAPGGDGPAAARLAAADPDRPWSRPATEPCSGAPPIAPSGAGRSLRRSRQSAPGLSLCRPVRRCLRHAAGGLGGLPRPVRAQPPSGLPPPHATTTPPRGRPPASGAAVHRAAAGSLRSCNLGRMLRNRRRSAYICKIRASGQIVGILGPTRRMPG